MYDPTKASILILANVTARSGNAARAMGNLKIQYCQKVKLLNND